MKIFYVDEINLEMFTNTFFKSFLTFIFERTKFKRNIINGLQPKYLDQRRNMHEITGNIICPNMLRGIDHIKDPRLNKGLAFTLEERQALGIHGLLAPKFKTQEEQLEFCQISFDRYDDDLNRYLYLTELQDRNEKLFFSLLDCDIEKFMPIVYTPTVGLACQKFGLVYRRPRGLYITIHDKGHIFDILKNWPEHAVRAIVFTDGERILGLGDLGAYGMGIPVGKLALYTALAGIKPHQCLPITLDVGTENETLLEDPIYIGLRQKRVRGPAYDEFIDEFMAACINRFGTEVLLQFEDFALPNAGRLLNKYREHYCTFNDDVQGTAGVAVAGMMAATRITKRKLKENTYLFFGAGSAATGIATLTVQAMVEEGLSKKEALSKIFMFDINGLLSKSRPEGVPDYAKAFGKDVKPERNLEQVIKNIKATCIVVGGAFTPAVLKRMASNSERPIIFALSNPTSKAECTAQAAYDNTEGRCVFASGSPFPIVKYNGKEYTTGQGNNAYIFPGIALGVITSGAHTIPDLLFLKAARALAESVSEKDLEMGRIYPPLKDIKAVSISIAVELAKFTYSTGLATALPEPKDFKAYIEQHLYTLKYASYLPTFYKYPKGSEHKMKSIREAYKSVVWVFMNFSRFLLEYADFMILSYNSKVTIRFNIQSI
ncbi:NADP-dependent malic enzyme isoform X3 [Bombyx mori]|uniref:NADP-dependent malic enzyme isoform X3 n=1 Tax=Bombyx mori TaxID=7091 RepID=UPI000B3C630A